MKAQQSQVSINNSGKPVAMVISAVEYEQIELLKERYLKASIQEGLDDLAAGNMFDGSTAFADLKQQI